MQTKVKIRVAFFAYGGNSGFPSVICSHLPLVMHLTRLLDNHPCVGPDHWDHLTYSDTPVTMTRNRAAREAMRDGYDFLLMLDSDNVVDLYQKVEGLKGFLTTALDFAIPRLQRGLPTVIAAPYCGQPPDPVTGGRENIFAFHWELKEHDNPLGYRALEQYSIQHAAIMTGIQPAAAAATGVILYSLNAFSLLEPPYFKYEWTDKWQTEKGSTEDVQNTRDISMAALVKYGEDCLFIDWDNWAGHVKPKIVGKPYPTPVETITKGFVQAVLENHKGGDRMHFANIPEPKPEPKFDTRLPHQRGIDNPAAAQQPVAEVEEQRDLPPGAIGAINGRPIWPRTDDGYVACQRYAMDRYAQEGNKQPGYDGQADRIEQEEKENPKPHPHMPITEVLMVNGRAVKQLGFNNSEAERSVLSKLVKLMEKRLGRAIRVLEVGTWCGVQAVNAATSFEQEDSCVYVVDTWQGSPYDSTAAVIRLGGTPRDIFDENTKDLVDAGLIRVLHGESSAVAGMFPDQELDLIIVDSGHTYLEIERDTDCWKRHLAAGGMMLFHDYGQPGHPDVKRFLDERFGSYLNRIGDTSWAFVMKGDLDQADEETGYGVQAEVPGVLPAEAAGPVSAG